MSFEPQKDWRAEPCTKEQRQEIERRAQVGRLRWSGVLQVASKVTGRNIHDTGQLTKGEASAVIDELEEL